jgi:hypothetical protein
MFKQEVAAKQRQENLAGKLDDEDYVAEKLLAGDD